MDANDEKFHVGDRVFAPFYGYGTVVNIDADNDNYPIEVKWDDLRNGYFTSKGRFWKYKDVDDEYTIKVVTEEEVDKTKEVDAINPSHYQVSGIPEAIEIMQHLMTKEQFEGFLWGNIIKYSYRYGRKGDKAETAGKIAWYANKLKEVEK